MTRSGTEKFDFDAWMTLARADPEEFERRRRAAIERAISRASLRSQPRLRGLQWRIDMERERARTPMAACIRLSSMMWDSVAGEGGLLRALEAFREGTLEELQGPRRGADILPFSGRRSPA
jgi:Protein of unknown function (DUF3135)